MTNDGNLGQMLRDAMSQLTIKMLVSGSRIITNPEYVKRVIDNTLARNKLKPTMLISGGAKGVDTGAEAWAKENGIEIKRFLPDWKKYGKKAGMLRNTTMLNEGADILIVIWDGKSSGSKHMLTKARERGQNNLFAHDIYTHWDRNEMIAYPIGHPQTHPTI
jgi:hypothetical protein